MVDTIIRLWAYDPKRHAGVIFPRLNQPRGSVPGWVFAILDLFGIEPDRAVIVDSPTIFSEVEFAVPGSSLGVGPSDWYLNWLDFLPLKVSRQTPRKIYLGRTHMIDQGTVMGESYFGQLLQENGFEYFCPECHDIHTQASAIFNAEQIVFTEGSGIYAIELLVKSNARIFMIPRRQMSDVLFAPHVRPRATFSVIGESQSINRLPNRDGLQRSNSPSYFMNPRCFFDEMRKYDLIKNAVFSLKDFDAAEDNDSIIYFGSDEKSRLSQLLTIRSQRKKWGIFESSNQLLGDGTIDRIQDNVVSGWAWHPGNPAIRPRIAVIDPGTGQLLDEFVAEGFRGDLLRAGKGDGRYGFRYDLQQVRERLVGPQLVFRIQDSGFELRRSPITLESKIA